MKTALTLLVFGCAACSHATTSNPMDPMPDAGNSNLHNNNNTPDAAAGSIQLAPATTVTVGDSALASWFLTAADVDGDGVLDLVDSSPDDAAGDNQILLLHGDGHGGFATTDAVATEAPAQTVVADFDRTGTADIVGIAWDGMGPLPCPYLAGPTFTATTWGDSRDFERHLSAADFDGDGTPDLVAAWMDSTGNTNAGGFVIVKMPGFTVLQDVPAFDAATAQAVVGDFNGDGFQDVVAASGSAGALKLYLGDGTGHVAFAADVAVPGGGVTDMAAIDLNGDGLADVVTINSDLTVTVLLATGTGFGAPQVLPTGSNFPRGIAAGDFDHDGILDLAIGQPDQIASVRIFTGSSAGFTYATELPAPVGLGENLVVADFDGDGFADIAAPSGASVTLYLSTH